MIIVDDAHELHVAQFAALGDWLKSRVIGVSRWIMCRLDVIAPAEYRAALKEEARGETSGSPGSTIGRDYYVKVMQMQNRQPKRFRKIAADIAGRYFAHLPEFARNSVGLLGPALDEISPKLTPSNYAQLKEEIEQFIASNRISARVREALESRLPSKASADEKLATLRILAHREVRNTPQVDLFGEDESLAPNEEKISPDDEADADEIEERGKVPLSLVDGARIQLMHQYERPFYYGISKLSDASNMNIEQFISLSEPLVNELLAKIIRGKNPVVSVLSQHDTMQRRARELMARWDFPYCESVRKLVDWISEKCLERTMLDYAPLDDGANAFGVLQAEMDQVLTKSERLARVLHFAFAYKALVMIPDYQCKGRTWCLLELGGVPILSKGLTLKHGGFIEGRLTQLEDQLPV